MTRSALNSDEEEWGRWYMGGMSYTDELREMSKQAWDGDTEAGEKLLRMFSGLANSPENAHPEIVRHVARCIGRIIECDVEPREALCIKRKAHRSKSTGRTKARNDDALHEYCKARAQGISHDEAMLKAVTSVHGMTENIMKHIYDGTSRLERDLLVRLYTQ